MLGKIKLIPEKVKDHEQRLKNLIQEDFNDDKISEYFKECLVEFQKNPLSLKTIFDINADENYKDVPHGFLVGGLNNQSYIDGLTQYKIKEEKYRRDFETDDEYREYRKEQWSNYGVCDNPDQILKEYPKLNDPDRIFLVHMTPIFKKNQSEYGGWRWHKWGKYIGDYEPQYEYLYNEDIDMVFVYHIYEVEKDLKL